MKKRTRSLLVKLSALGLLLCVFGGGIEQSQKAQNATAKLFRPSVVCPGPKLIISELLPNPNGTDSPFEFVELRATDAINFAATPYSVVVTNNGTATTAGWIAGGSLTYGFDITTGSVSAGDVVYVGGTSMAPLGSKLRVINTGTSAGDGFGNANANGVIGNGGGNADSIAVFSSQISSLTNSTVPIDAIFYGTAQGNAVVSGGAAGYQLPVNDNYPGGKLQAGSFLGPDPGSSEYIVATGVFDANTCAFTTNRTWAISTGQTDGTSSVAFTPVTGTPSITESTGSHRLNLTTASGGALSGVVGDTTDPGAVLGVDFTIADSNTPVGNLTVTAVSGNTTVVPAANLNLTGAGTTRNLTITPAAVGYSLIKVTVSDGALSSNYFINYAASSPAVASASTRWHAGKADASTAIAVDTNYMFVADDEDQRIRLFDRLNSGTSVSMFDMTPNLALTDINGGVAREVDIEASARVGNRIYWLGSHSNASDGTARPNRSRLFATDVSGVGAAATLSYVGRYDNLKTDLIAWDTSNAHGLGAGFFGLSASAAVGKVPESVDGSGWNIEGLVFAPDNTTAYISFRAPIVPAANRTKALLVPVTNIAALVTLNPAPAPVFGPPIQLNLGGRGIRSIDKSAANEYLIVGGMAGGPSNFATFSWTGIPGDPALVRISTLTGLNPEAIVEVPVGINALSLVPMDVPILSDNGDDVYYNDGILAKDLANDNHKKFRSDIVNIGVIPVAANVSIDGRTMAANGRGIGRARVYLTNAETGERFVTITSSLGYFRFEDVPVGVSYVLSVDAKGYAFPSRVVSPVDEITGLEIVAEP